MEYLEPQKLIEASALFRNLQPEETAAIIARLQPARYEQGARILERGVWHGRLHIIATGKVSVDVGTSFSTSGADEREGVETRPASFAKGPYIVAHLGPGECLGEISLITGEPPTATVRAEQDTTVWSLSQTDFLTLLVACPTLLQNINHILALRLERTNQQILFNHAAVLVWLALVDQSARPVERSLAFHIADALAACSRKRVLMLELCEHDQAMGPHFATTANQLRPSLLECIQDRASLQAHHAPTTTTDGQPYAALATLTARSDETLSADTEILAALMDLAIQYDYLLLVTTQATPAALVRAVAEQSQRAIIVMGAQEGGVERMMSGTKWSHHSDAGGVAPIGSLFPFLQEKAPGKGNVPLAVFIAHVSEQPTIGLQDRYAAQVGCAITRLLPANTPLLERCWKQQTTIRELAPGADLTKAVDFVARHIAHQTVGIAFGGGGARGFAHLGVLERLVHHGVPIDYIAACSSGIITPGMYLLGKSFAESEEIFLEIQRHIVQWSFPRTAIFSNRGLKHMLQGLCGEMRFEDLATPFAMVAVDLTTRAGVVLDRGLLWQAGLASVALPGFFPPVLVGEHILMDAGMHDPVPIRLVRRMGADILLASELGGQEPPSLESATPWLQAAADTQSKHIRSPHIVDLLLRTYDLTMATIGMHSIREADVVIHPKLHRVSLRQFSEGRKFVAAGRDAVEQALPALKKYLPWL